MYARNESRETRRDVLLSAMREIQFAALVTPGTEQIHATHLPMVVADGADGEIRLQGHFARTNPHWRALADNPRSIAIFQGPHAYVSPNWYETKRETGKAVPTWAYVAVHAEGALAIVDDPAWLRRNLEALTAANEAGRPDAWSLDDAPDGFINALSRGVVGVELRVERLAGAWKLNQHRSAADRLGMIDGLRGEPTPLSAVVAGLAAETLDEPR